MTENEMPPDVNFSQGAWRNALLIWLLGCVILGCGCFVAAGRALQAWPSRFWAAVCWQLSFAVGLSAILAAIVFLQRSRGLSLSSVGWRKPSTKTTIAIGIGLGLLYTLGVYAGILNDPRMKDVNPFDLHWVRFALIPVGVYMAFAEETMMRGFFMTELSRARVPTWLQVLLSGVCSGVYHSFQNLTRIGLLPSVILFTLHAILYIASRRSLTPVIIAHSLYHVLGAPYLLMFAMAQSQR